MASIGTLREGEILLGKYRIGPLVGEGGMAVIYKAYNMGVAGFQRPVVIKVIKPYLSSSKDMRDQFVREASVGASLDHPNIVQVMDLGEFKGSLYMVLEYVAGKDLSALIFKARQASRVLSPELIAFIAVDVCKALECSHGHIDHKGRARPIIHRDISPQNIMLSREGHVKLADFGMARALGATRLTAQGVIKGKLSYMSPEQSRPGSDIDGRSDLFSLGIVMWEACTGRRLFLAKEPMDTIRRVRDCSVPNLQDVAPHVPAELAAVIHHVLQPDPNSRFAAASDMGRAIQSYLRSAKRVDANVLASVLESYFPPELTTLETADPSLSFSDEALLDDEDEDSRATILDNTPPPDFDNEPPDSPVQKHTLVMAGGEADDISRAVRRAIAEEKGRTLLGTPSPIPKKYPQPAGPHLTEPDPAPARMAQDRPPAMSPPKVSRPKPSPLPTMVQQHPMGTAAGHPPMAAPSPIPQPVAPPPKKKKNTKKSRLIPLLVSLLIGIPMGIGIGVLVFWLLTRSN